ncbi:hypothetical protein PsYK624_075210 [Phanerochaete sordida]|uniref:Uncharacterized protein n=1 Tax=Phanerochaete sordida TaxID=48140 RepID=A0A9P3GAM2_9APHY|nr:hypothetical protein PsYK624_075210 [Phanerochaete sordida]
MNASTSLVTTDMMDFDQQLAQLLGGMTLQNTWNVVPDVAPHDASAPHTPPAAQDAFMSDSSDTEDAAYPARCPSPLFFSAPLLTFDDLDAHFGGAGSKGKSRRGGGERRQRSGGVHAVRLRTSASHARPVDLGPLPYHRRRVSGGHLHAPRGVQRVPAGTPRVRDRLLQPCELPRVEGAEGRS